MDLRTRLQEKGTNFRFEIRKLLTPEQQAQIATFGLSRLWAGEWVKWAVEDAGNLNTGRGDFSALSLPFRKGEKNEGQKDSHCRG